MRKNFGAKPSTYPQPVFILAAYDEDGKPNAMNAAWGGISDDQELSLCISAGHKTTANILARKAFTVSIATVAQLAACDYVGRVSGSDTPDKLAKSVWHVTKSSKGDAPLFDELPLTLENLKILLDVPEILTRCQTYAFTVLGISQLFHAIGMRDVETSIFRMNHLENRLMLAAFCIGLSLQILVTEFPYFVAAFGTCRLSLSEWTRLMLLAAAPLLAHELLLLAPGKAARRTSSTSAWKSPESAAEGR